MAQIEIQATGSPRWRWSDLALRRDPRAQVVRDRRRLHEGRGLLLPMIGWADAGRDVHLRATPIGFR